MGKWGAFMLQNLVTMVKRSRAKGSPLYKGEAKGQRSNYKPVGTAPTLDLKKSDPRAPSSFLKASLATFHSGRSSSVRTRMVSTIRYMMLSRTLQEEREAGWPQRGGGRVHARTHARTHAVTSCCFTAEQHPNAHLKLRVNVAGGGRPVWRGCD